MPAVSKGGLGGRAIALGAIKGLHINDLSLERYQRLVFSSQLVADDASFGYGVDLGVGPMWVSTGFGAPGINIADVNFQLVPSWPVPRVWKIRNVTAVAAARGLSASGAGVLVPLTTGETVEITPGGLNQSFRLIDPTTVSRGTHRAMAMRIRIKNSLAFGVGDLIYFGWGKVGLPATFEAYTDFVGFKLIKGAASEADIFAVSRQVSGAVSAIDTGREIAVNTSNGLGFVDLELQISGRKGSLTARFLVNGANVKNIRLPTAAAQIYNPSIFVTAATAAWATWQISRFEIGPVECMERE